LTAMAKNKNTKPAERKLIHMGYYEKNTNKKLECIYLF